MKYFIDTEFIESSQTKRLLSIPIGKTKPTIDLISIGIVAEDGREYYAISKDFNLKEAWYRYDLKRANCHIDGMDTFLIKVYWIRENVLKPIFDELVQKNLDYYKQMIRIIPTWTTEVNPKYHIFTYRNFKRLLKLYGKTNKQIAEEIKDFCLDNIQIYKSDDGKYTGGVDTYKGKPKFYGYYADYDWVCFCWLFGRMIDLPKDFPMYCIDLKQELDRKLDLLETYQISKIVFPNGDKAFTNDNDGDLSIKLKRIKTSPNYPKQTNEHNALDDAKWNKELYEFLNNF